MTTEFFVNFPCFSIIAALLASAVSTLLGKNAARRLSVAVTALIFCASLCTLYYTASAGEAVTYYMGHFPAPWGNELRFGIIEPLLAALFALVMCLCLAGGAEDVSLRVRGYRQNLFYIMADLAMASLLALAYTNDIFTGYVFVEICTVAACGLLAARDTGKSIAAAMRYMIFSLIGSGFLMLGIIFLYGITGHLLMPQLKEAVGALWQSGDYRLQLVTALCLLTVGPAIKSGLFPFHLWMPDTYGTALPGAAGILSGIISKGYIVLLLKVVFQVAGPDVFYASGAQNILLIFGICAMVFGSLGAIRAADISRMNAFSSAAQIGYIYMGIGISPEAGVLAAIFHILCHALTKPAIFLSSGRLIRAAGGKSDFASLQGAAKLDRPAGVIFTIGSMSMVGIPLTMGFISKIFFVRAGVGGGGGVTVAVLLALAVSTALNVVYFLRTVIRVYTPAGAGGIMFPHEAGEPDSIPEEPETEAFEQDEDVSLPPPEPVVLAAGEKARRRAGFIFAGTALAALNVVIGVHSQPLADLLQKGLELLG